MFIWLRQRAFVGATAMVLLASLALAACGSSSTTTGTSSTAPKNVVVGGKLDPEAQILTKLYTLLLKHAGYNVTEKARLGTNDVVFNAITSGQIDLYPEFTATGLFRLKLTPTGDTQSNYTQVKQGYETQYHITWLDIAPMNDTYGLCLPKATATAKNLTTISDLAKIANTLTVATPPDGNMDPGALPGWTKTYNFSFKNTVTLGDEAPTFAAVTSGQADVNVCYTTNGLISKDNFLLLQDDKGVSPAYNPAPIVRDAFLTAHPDVAGILNPLAPKLTTAAITALNASAAADGSNITQIATQFLQQQGLI